MTYQRKGSRGPAPEEEPAGPVVAAEADPEKFDDGESEPEVSEPEVSEPEVSEPEEKPEEEPEEEPAE